MGATLAVLAVLVYTDRRATPAEREEDTVETICTGEPVEQRGSLILTETGNSASWCACFTFLDG